MKGREKEMKEKRRKIKGGVEKAKRMKKRRKFLELIATLVPTKVQVELDIYLIHTRL